MANPLDQVASWSATAAAGVASAAGLLELAGPAERPYRWASVTKLLVALAALDAVQRGLLDLDEPDRRDRRSGTCYRTRPGSTRR